MEPTEYSTLEDFERWHVLHLTDFLTKRGLTETGKKLELAALAYTCHVMKKTAIEASNVTDTFNDYQSILHIPNGIVMPDPFKFGNGWVSETNDGMKYWSPLSIVDIIDFFREQHTNTDKLLTDYKAGKAYDYFKTEWLKEVHYNSVNQLCSGYPRIENYCLLRAKCTPSQQINDPAHDVWILVEKGSGHILSEMLLQLCCWVSKIV